MPRTKRQEREPQERPTRVQAEPTKRPSEPAPGRVERQIRELPYFLNVGLEIARRRAPAFTESAEQRSESDPGLVPKPSCEMQRSNNFVMHSVFQLVFSWRTMPYWETLSGR